MLYQNTKVNNALHWGGLQFADKFSKFSMLMELESEQVVHMVLFLVFS